MSEPGWQQHADPDLAHEYLVLATYFHIRSMWRVPRFFRLTGAIRNQLADAEGLVGYSLKSRVLRRRFWTKSAWRDERALLRFVRTTPHVEVMTRLRPDMLAFGSVRWRAPGGSVPPTWDEALERLSAAEASA